MTTLNYILFTFVIISLAIAIAYCSFVLPMRVVLIAVETILVLIVFASSVPEPPARLILRALNVVLWRSASWR
jgi:hypothetical protein